MFFFLSIVVKTTPINDPRKRKKKTKNLIFWTMEFSLLSRISLYTWLFRSGSWAAQQTELETAAPRPAPRARSPRRCRVACACLPSPGCGLMAPHLLGPVTLGFLLDFFCRGFSSLCSPALWCGPPQKSPWLGPASSSLGGRWSFGYGNSQWFTDVTSLKNKKKNNMNQTM